MEEGEAFRLGSGKGSGGEARLRAFSWILICLVLTGQSVRAAEPTGFRQDVVFHENSPWSTNAELARRGLSPLKRLALANDLAELAKQHKVLAEQPLVPEEE